MRSIPALALAAALIPAARLVQEDAQDAEDPPPVLGLHQGERERLEQAIEGTWLLQRFDPADVVVNPANVQGMAIFREGFLSLNVMAQSFAPEFLGDGLQLFVQGGGHRYRINEYLELQTAAVLGFQNFDHEDLMTVETAGTPREYRLEIDQDGATMRMTRPDGTMLTWSRLTESAFPTASSDYLDRTRGK